MTGSADLDQDGPEMHLDRELGIFLPATNNGWILSPSASKASRS